MSSSVHIEIDGARVDAEALWSTTSAYGHFTAMQVRGRRTRGLELHLRRLEAANRELFGAGLDRERVCELIRHALQDVEDASVRVYVFESDAEPVTMVTVKEPGGVTSPQRLQSVHYQRPDAHLKHLASGQGFYSRLARRNGFDDALLTTPTESSPKARSPTSASSTGQASSGRTRRTCPGSPCSSSSSSCPGWACRPGSAPVRVQEIASFEGAFLSNARGVAVVSEVDGISLPIPTERMTTVAEAYESVPWDTI